MKRLCLALLLIVSVLAGTQSPAAAIINGDPDGNQHPYVGLIVNDELACSASAISPRVLVTAAHCIADGPDEFWVSFQPTTQLASDGWPDLTAPGLVHGTGQIITDYCEACGPGLIGFASPDVGVVVLDTPVTLPRYAQLPSVGLVDHLRTRQPVTKVGYGVNQFLHGDGPPLPTTDFVRRTSPAELLPTNRSIADWFVRAQSIGTPGQSQACYGDSGGPLLLGDTILGVNSFGNGQCSVANYYSRIDRTDVLSLIPQA
ncbi:MAG TPA: trypsin-like serine protease [Nocardioides sp.]|nr:trypsin-like serine protease [Nocardioides sp.]